MRSVPLDLTTVDFETEAIGPRPMQYPPKPVGVAIHYPDGNGAYYAWGHPEICLDGSPGGNNCTFEDGVRAVRGAFRGPVLFHNGAFDIEVAMVHMGLDWPRVWHDTLFLLFLHDPHAKSFSLKPSAERLLDEPPTEQDAVRDWIIANVPGATRKNFGAHICLAPVSLVGPYALGDVGRTRRLFGKLAGRIFADMHEPYMREIRLCPHLVAAERRGIRVDRDLLRQWEGELDAALTRCDELIRARLNAPMLAVDSDDELVEALDREGVMSKWELTDGTIESEAIVGPNASVGDFNPFGVDGAAPAVVPTKIRTAKRSVAKPAMKRCCTDTELVATLDYRNTAATMLRTFIRPWLEQSQHDGRLHTKWHQVRGQEKNGTRTGRIASADPNLANVPNPKDTAPPAPGLPFLPSLRCALLPEPGHVWISIDYSQQELRITAHYEDGAMMRAYQRDSRLDLHAMAQKLVLDITGLDVQRKYIKIVAFSTIYGSGIPGLATQMGVDPEEAASVRAAYFKALPGLPLLNDNVKAKVRLQGYVRSAGGRVIRLEEPKIVKGRMRSFEYKMLNHLVQGTAADQTKEAIVRFCEAGYGPNFMGQVYDQIDVSAPAEAAPVVIAALLAAMKGALTLDVPMECDVEVGESWGTLQAWEPEGVTA